MGHTPAPRELRSLKIQHRVRPTCLVVDDAPRVRHEFIVLPREGMVPSARRAEGVAADAEVRGVWDGLAHVDRRERRQGAAQTVAC